MRVLARCRPDRRPRLTGRIRKRYIALLIILPLVGWLVWRALAIVSARPGPLVDYTSRLADLSAAHQPEGENGWPALAAALEHFDAIGVPEGENWPTDPDAAWQARGLEGVWRGTFDRDRLRFELAYLQHIQQSGVLEELDRMLTAPRFVRTDFPGAGAGLIAADFSEGRHIYWLARSRRASMRVSLDSGEAEQFARAWKHLLLLCRARSFDALLVSGLAGMSHLEMGLDELALALTEHRLDESVCRSILDSLTGQPVLAPLAMTWESERLFCYDTIQRTHTDDGRGNGILLVETFAQYLGFTAAPNGTLPVGGAQPPLYNLLGLRYASRSETTQLIDRYFDAAIEQSELSRSARRHHSLNLGAFSENLPSRHAFSRLMLTATASVNEMRDVTESKLAATRILLAIEAYEDRHGRLPPSLDALAPGFTQGLPLDPVSERPFVYHPRRGGAQDPRPFWLYSIGLDGEDNGGVETAKTGRRRIDALRDERDGQGYDYIYNALREPVEDH
ncbi:MAG: hypothetical protein KJZ69_01430 [Phycisphaerales bacterium]|nr:hypothetical protein [Phycisphaerales bacterium]